MNKIPSWFKTKISVGDYPSVCNIIKDNKLHTVCFEARCPNKSECFSHGVATFLIMGNVCTRNCRYCNIGSGKPSALDKDEPKRVADTIKKMKLKYAVITSVTRDDLIDGGAAHFAETVKLLNDSDCKVETLIPDLKKDNLKILVDAQPDVISHNMEVVERLFQEIRPKASYQESLKLLGWIKEAGIKSKSGLMLGFGENEEEIIKTLHDLRSVGCDFVTLGQYLQPSKKHTEVKKYYTPEEFEKIKKVAEDIGFEDVACAPLVRSSYRADKLCKKI